MNRFFFLTLVVVLFLMKNSAFGQELPRSASFGAQVSDLNDSTRAALRLSSLSGTLIKKVVPGSSAQKAGFIVDDVLISMNGESIENTSRFLQLLKKHHGGDKVKISYFRNSKLKSTSMILLPKQRETSPDYEIIYSSVLSGNNHLRTIITRPKGGSIYPAVLLIGGVGCYSIDNPSVTEILSIKMWVDSLTRNGYVTIRVEKTGMGDGKGIIVYGTVGRNWLEYELENSLRQQLLVKRPADSLDLYMRAEYIRLYGLFVEKKSPQQIIYEHPETTANFFEYPMRTEYFQQVADVNIRELWMNTKAKVLAMHGSSDFVSSATEHKVIAETVNQYNPGNATYIEIANSDHWGLFAESDMISYSHRQTELNTLSLTTALKWLKAN